jgi:hypothetical protein
LKSGRARSWGENYSGEVGIGTPGSGTDVLVAVKNLNNLRNFDGGYEFTLAPHSRGHEPLTEGSSCVATRSDTEQLTGRGPGNFRAARRIIVPALDDLAKKRTCP